MIKVYGSPKICKSCRNLKHIIETRKLIMEEIDIIENTSNMRAFLQIRDNSSAFDDVRKNGRIGIPCFVKEDGTVTVDMNEALSWMNEPPVKEDEIVEKEEVVCEDCENIMLHRKKQ
ncbi:MAG: glutaredoxin [Erysipelotrichaceae bacterium]|nr:glutaredoxin [Erysipelotrichaceae bacterium]